MGTSCLDLRKFHLKTDNIAAFARKPEATAAAIAAGWRAADVTRAANRFSKFWVIGQSVGADVFRLLTTDGSIVEIRYPGRWS